MFEYSNIRIPFEYSNAFSEFEYSNFYLSPRCASSKFSKEFQNFIYTQVIMK